MTRPRALVSCPSVLPGPLLPRACALLFGGLLLLNACSSTDEPYVERPVDVLYNEAMDNLEAGDDKKAAKLFDEVERQHPYSSWATKAQLMAA